MNDPLSPLTAPPPRYLLESDSSDEEGQGAYASSSRPTKKAAAAFQATFSWELPVSAQSSQTVSPSSEAVEEEVIIGVGQVGRYIARKAGLKGDGDLNLVKHGARGKRTAGIAWKSTAGWIVNVEEAEGEEAWAAARQLVDQLKAKRWTILAAYVPAMYIPDPDARSEDPYGPAPVRALNIGSSPAQASDASKWESPNYFTGIAGALGAMAAHPAHSAITDATVLALPLPLSYLDDRSLLQALQSASPASAQQLESSLTSGAGRQRWTEQDDEPYEGLGMGSGKRREPIAKAEVGTMYM